MIFPHQVHIELTWAAEILPHDYMGPGYFTLAPTALKPQQIPMVLHISARVWGRR